MRSCWRQRLSLARGTSVAPRKRKQVPLPDLSSKVAQLEGIVQRQLAILELDQARCESADPREQPTGIERTAHVRRMHQCAQTLTSLGKLTGETMEITPAKLVQAPAFRRMLDVMAEALAPWPEALRACGTALKVLSETE